MNDIQVSDNILYLNSRVLTDSEQSLVKKLVHVLFFYKHIFWRSGSDMLSQNLEGGSNYASDMLIFCLLYTSPSPRDS